MFARIRFVCLALCAVAVGCALATPAAAQCPAKTTVADTLYNADGSLASGRVTIAWPTFLIGSCQVIAGQTTVTVTNGSFSMQLYPNTNAVPSGTSYRITFALRSGRISTEYWVVPASATPVSLASVRAPSVPVPTVMFGQAQVTNLVADLANKLQLPSPCPPGKVLESNGSSAPPQVNCVDPSSGSGSQHRVNGANLASNNLVDFQDTPSIAFTNPGAGIVQASIPDGAVTAAKLAVASPSSAQLAGIGDSNIAAASLSPNRIVGTAVAQARAISTTSPITGGGDLSADRTIACAACVTSISGTADEISSTGGATPTLSLSPIVNLSTKTLKGSAPLVFDGVTADTSKTMVVVTDPTAARSFTLPNANSVAVQPATCSGTDKVSAISTLGMITCAADQTGGGSTHNLLSATHTDTLAASPVLGDLLYGNATPAWTTLAGNTTATNKYLSQTGTGAASAAPVWSQPAFSELSGSATAGQVPNLENHNGTLTPTQGGTGANNAATNGRYLRGDGTNFATSSVAAAGAGSCTNQFVRATVDNAVPACATVAKADAVSTFVHTDQGNTYSTGTQDFESATVTRPYRRLAFASFPGTCTANREFLERSDPATAGQVVYVCNASGTGWDLVGDGGGGGGGLGDPGANGVVVRTALDTTVARSITGTANQIVITDGDGVGGNPVIDVGAQVVQTDQGNTWTAGSQDLGSATSLIVPKGAGAAPTADGDERYDTTREAFAAGGNGAVTGFFPRLLKMTNCTTEANCTSTNEVDANSGQQGTTEANFASNWSMPANFLFTNKAVQVCGVFELTTSSGAPTLTIRLKAGSTVLVATAAVAPLASQTNRGATQCYLVQGTAAAGASVSVEAGFFGTTIPHAIGSTGFNATSAIDQPVTGIATNGALTLQLSAQWGTATTGNTIQLHQLYVMELN